MPIILGGVAGGGVSTDNAAVRWDGIGGDIIQDSTVTIDDDGLIAIDSTGSTSNLEIGYFSDVSSSGYGIRQDGAGGYFLLMPNANFPQVILGHPDNTTGQAYIDVDNNRPLNLNVLDTGAGTPALVRIGSGGLEISSGGDITLGASGLVDGVDVGSPNLSIVVVSNRYQLENDVASPGNNKVYGTDGSGNKGWFDK